jgi:hypothetical protein
MKIGKHNRRLIFELTAANSIVTLPIRNVRNISYIEAVVPSSGPQTPPVAANLGVSMRVLVDNVQLSDQFVNVAFFHPESLSGAKAVQHDIVNTQQAAITVESQGLAGQEKLLVQVAFDGFIGVQ